MTARYLSIVIPLLAFVGGPPVANADPSMPRVTVRVYETVGLNAELQAALAVAGRTLASASTDVAWKHCDPHVPHPGCEGPPAGELVLRIVRVAPERHEKQLPLGDALVVRSGEAVLATIYFDRVVRVAHGAQMHTATLLGYAVAHELGHLLLASSVHNTEGLMRPMWRADELRSPRAADWSFTDRETAAIQVRLAAVARRYPENPIHRPPHPTVDQRAMEVIATTLWRSGEK